MFLESRRVRQLIPAIFAAGCFIMVIPGLLVGWSDAETASDWRLIFWICLALGVGLTAATILTPHKTAKRKRFDALELGEARLNSWCLYKTKHDANHLVLLASAEDLYLSDRVPNHRLVQLKTIHQEQRAVETIESGMLRWTKRFEKLPIHLVDEITAEPHRLTLGTSDGSFDFALSGMVDHESVAATVAGVAMPGVPAGSVIMTHEVGLIRRRPAEREVIRYRRHPSPPMVGGTDTVR